MLTCAYNSGKNKSPEQYLHILSKYSTIKGTKISNKMTTKGSKIKYDSRHQNF